MRAKFIRGRDSKKSLDLGISKKINIRFEFQKINKDESRAKDYLERFKSVLKQIDPKVDIIDERTFVLYESGDVGELDYGGVIKASIITNLSTDRIAEQLKLSEYEDEITGDIMYLHVNIIEYE